MTCRSTFGVESKLSDLQVLNEGYTRSAVKFLSSR